MFLIEKISRELKELLNNSNSNSFMTITLLDKIDINHVI